MMVTVQHPAGVAAYWQPNHLLPYPAACAPIIPCQWHAAPATPAYVPVLPHHHHPPPVATVEPEQPIGYGSFGVVW